jgi:hypothetical protein
MTDKYYWVQMTWHGAQLDLREVWKLTLGQTAFAHGLLAKGGLRRPGWFISTNTSISPVIATLPTRTSLADAQNIAKTILLSLKETES